MKLLSIIYASFLISFACYSQTRNTLPITEDKKGIEYSEIIELNNPKDALFKNAKVWMAKTFQDYKAVIQIEDKDSGKLILKGISKIEAVRNDLIRFTIIIDCKDNKYRCVINDVEARGRVLNSYVKLDFVQNAILESEEKEIQELKKSLAVSKNKKDQKKLETAQYLYDAVSNENILINQTMDSLLNSLENEMKKKDDF